MSLVTQTRIKEIYPLMKESVARMDEYIGQHLNTDIDVCIFLLEVINFELLYAHFIDPLQPVFSLILETTSFIY